MKKIILFTSVLLITQITLTLGQCIADAGPDKVVCHGIYGIDTIQIGGNPSALGGIPPYTYAWEANYVINIGSYTWTMTASDFLNDTTLPNPSIVYPGFDITDAVEFYLTIHDSIGSICQDNVLINYSMINYTNQIFIFDLQQGDSIFLNWGVNAWSTFPTVEYLWRPNSGLNDSTSLSFWAKPDYTTNYYVTITDSAGCVFRAPDYYSIHVIPVSITESEKKEHSILGIPNPVNELIQLTVKNENENHSLVIHDLYGHKVKELEVPSGTTMLQINVSDWESGLYTVVSHYNGKISGTGKFIVR